ncbi:MAG TPA: hypothetical protein VGA99_01815, partial [bacterium]
MNFRFFVFIVMVIFLMSLAVSFAQDTTAVSKRINALDQRIRVLEGKLELEKQAATTEPKTTPVLTASSSGFSFQSGDGAYAIKFRG